VNVIAVHHDIASLLSWMVWLIFRTTPGLIIRWLSGTATHTPEGCAHLLCRPSVLIRAKPAFLSRLTTDLVGSSVTTTIVKGR
jgi:hypothetical protein